MFRRHSLSVLFVLLSAVVAGCQTGSTVSEQQKRVGFDLDDTLVFSTPAFQQAFESDVRAFSSEFWEIVNRSDRGNSCIKPRTRKILRRHRSRSHKIYVITAREPHNTGPARTFIFDTFKIPKENVYFEPDGKADLLEQLKIDVYYGDSDSDITAAQKADVKAIRIKRSPQSDYNENYNPGRYGEKIISNSSSHRC